MRVLTILMLVLAFISPATATPKDTDITSKQLNLGVSLLRQGSDQDANRTLSPYSIHSALMLLRLGARGEVASQLDQKLLPGSFSPELQTVYQAMNSAIITSNDTVTSVVANSLWLQTGYEYGDRYRAGSEKIFSAEPRHVDYQKPEPAREEINAWVSSKTHSLIPQLLPQGVITRETTCTIVNALYFKAAWIEAFKKELTKDEKFWLTPSREINVPMMHHNDRMGYFENSEWVGVHLPYKAYDYTFVVLMPKRALAAEELSRRLSPKLFSQAMQEQEFTKVNLAMPKFKVRQSRDLLKQLSVYGLTRLATGDYTDISPNGIGSVGAILHEAVVTVDEGGTEAAAATAVVMTKAFNRDEKPAKDVKVDHPFAFALIHKPTQAPLFLGVVGDPR
jgi:serpin B